MAGAGELDCCVGWIGDRASDTAVVRANAGTHNHRQRFGEDSSFGTSAVRNDGFRGMGPGLRRDDTVGLTRSAGFVGWTKALPQLSDASSRARLSRAC
ncbi:hypothetical protein V1280_004005 [Bradyrhizobium sp. AZCC 2230]